MGRQRSGRMSKAQLSGAVGYTGYIRPSLQCTQQSSLKPGRHCPEGGSYWPTTQKQPPILSLKTNPATLTADMSNLMSPDTYSNHERQDRPAEAASLTSARCSHWKSIGAEAFRLRTPPARTQTLANERLFQNVMPSTNYGSTYPKLTSTAQLKTMVSPSGMNRSPRRRHKELREGSREYLMSLQDAGSREQVDGTSKVTKAPPGYMGHVPHVLTNSPTAVHHGTRQIPRGSQRCKADTLFDSFNERPIGYLGYAPTTVFNRRTWSPPSRTTNGALDSAMIGMGHKLQQPAAGGESAILKEFFAGPLAGRPSDNGQFEAQVFYARVRPFEGAPRGHFPSKCHPAGRLFASPSVTMKNWGNTERGIV